MMTGVTLSILTMVAALAIGAAAIFVLALRTGSGVLWRISGLFAAVLGLLMFFYGYEIFPWNAARYVEALAFGTAYLGQTLVMLFLAFKVMLRAQLKHVGAAE